MQRRRALIDVLEDAVPESSHAQTVATAALLPRDRHAHRRRAVRRSRRLRAVREARAAVGVPRDRTERVHLEREARSGPDHQGRSAARAQAAGRGRPPLPSPASGRRGPRGPPGRPGPPRRADRLALPAPPARALDTSRRAGAASAPGPSRSPAHASSPRSAGRPRPWTDTHDIHHSAPAAAGALTSNHEGRHVATQRAREHGLWATQLHPAGWRPLLDCEPGDEQGS